MSEGYFVKIEKLTAGYGDHPVAREVSFELKKGEILTLIGPNGAGKTTILRSLIGQLSPMSGTVELAGRELQDLSRKELAETLAVVMTDRQKPELITCEEVVSVGRYPYTGRFGRLSEEDRKKVHRAMEMVGVEELSSTDFSRISDGQRQRVILARALCQEPEILVLDEPISYLDVRYKAEFLSALQRMSRAEGTTVILSLHEVDLASRISDRVASIRNGALDRIGPPEEIFSPGYVSQLYEMEEGQYIEDLGGLELSRPEGEPQVFVIAGNGTGTPVFRQLQRAGTPFSAGILWENDRDYPVAKALAGKVFSVPIFAEPDPVQIEQALSEMERCPDVVCTLPEELRQKAPESVRKLLERAEKLGKLKE